MNFLQSTDRRQFLAAANMGLTSVALGSLLHQTGTAASRDAAASSQPHLRPKAKNVIWIFLVGGLSHMESFDPKPALNRFAEQSIRQSPFQNVLNSPLRERLRDFTGGETLRQKILPLQVGYRQHGESGIEVSDWWPHVASRIDDIAVVRSMWTSDNNHSAQLQFHTGRHRLDGSNLPTVGAWVHYGLGSLSDDLPQFIVIGKRPAETAGGNLVHAAGYLGPEHEGVKLEVDGDSPLPFASPGPEVYREEQQGQLQLLRRLNQLSALEYPSDTELRARLRSYELAFRMQTSVPELLQFDQETEQTHQLYGMDDSATLSFGRVCLAARRLVERGVRFVQIYHGANGGAGAWDAHKGLRTRYNKLCRDADKPIAGLLTDLKQRGLLDETVVVFASEFGRTPGLQDSKMGRDHHPYGFSVWLSGAGLQGGLVHGATDELGFHAVEHPHYVTDIHATVLHLLGLQPHRLQFPGQKRLEMDYGRTIEQILV